MDVGIVDERERMVLADFVDHASFALGMAPPVVVGVLPRKAVDVTWVEIERVLGLNSQTKTAIRYLFSVRCRVIKCHVSITLTYGTLAFGVRLNLEKIVSAATPGFPVYCGPCSMLQLVSVEIKS